MLDLIGQDQRALIRLAETYARRHHARLHPPSAGPVRPVLPLHHVLLLAPRAGESAGSSDALKRIDVLTARRRARWPGSTVPIDRDFLKDRSLGFARRRARTPWTRSPTGASSSKRSSPSPLLLLDLSRSREDFVIFSTAEFGFLVLDDSIATSSSLMPQKKNPDFFELIRAGAGELFGHLSRLFITVKGLPSTYNKDLQEDKAPLRQGVEETIQILEVFETALGRIAPNPEEIKKKAESFLFATDLVDYLVGKGVPFRKAHGIIGLIVHFAEKKGVAMDKLELRDFRRFHSSFAGDLYGVFDPGRSVRQKKTRGSTHPDQVKLQIGKAKKLL